MIIQLSTAMKFLVLLTACVALALADTYSESWTAFKVKHAKSYSNIQEEKSRYAIFQANLKRIEEHNKNYDAGLLTWKMAVNQFADLTKEEFKARLPKLDVEAMKTARGNTTKFRSPAGVKVPSSYDWREYGAVTEVKTQLQCGGCWAFSATGSLEGQYFLKHGNLLSFSEQNLIDCVTTNAGCNGGVIEWSFDYIQQNGIMLESDYPFTGEDGTCHFDQSRSATSCNGYTDLENNNEQQLLEAVATVGPISVALNADGFEFYSSGVYNDLSCSDQVNHGVLVVGYGSENGQDYWIVKNSWSAEFGENGYIRMLRGQNICAIASFPSYPNL